jgi:hypothetical protein
MYISPVEIEQEKVLRSRGYQQLLVKAKDDTSSVLALGSRNFHNSDASLNSASSRNPNDADSDLQFEILSSRPYRNTLKRLLTKEKNAKHLDVRGRRKSTASSLSSLVG